ncbi:MAG: FMN-binding negative transcriptional regulator [Rhodospirillales bacterium]|nr:FMN-binding negative transcriptional regulator [Rhodospirillales bacterium]
MYLPPAFSENDLPTLHAAIAATGLATLVSHGPAGLIASHVPLILAAEEGEYGTLYGHLARANPQAREAAFDGEALAIFQGPDAYVTPSWYATKRETGKVVPTWNYAAIHAYGTLRFIDDAAGLRPLLEALTTRHESRRAAPWAVDDAPADFVAAQMKGIRGFAIPITRLEGKWKMSQNRPAADRAGVIAGLAADDRNDVAALVEARAPKA